jgi:Sigma-70 region 2
VRSGVESWKQTLAELAGDRLMSLKRQAFLLCGDESQAEDLVQDALVRAFARPLRAPRRSAAEAYVRAIMVNLFIDGARRRSRWNRAAPLLAGTETVTDPASQVLDRDVMLTWTMPAQLPPGPPCRWPRDGRPDSKTRAWHSSLPSLSRRAKPVSGRAEADQGRLARASGSDRAG